MLIYGQEVPYESYAVGHQPLGSESSAPGGDRQEVSSGTCRGGRPADVPGPTYQSLVSCITHRLLRSSFLGLPYRILNTNHKKELLRSLWVGQGPGSESDRVPIWKLLYLLCTPLVLGFMRRHRLRCLNLRA